MLIRIVQISSLATTCIGQPLLTFLSHTEQNCTFVLIIAAFKGNLYCFASLLPMINLKGLWPNYA